jgi:glycosyltransferase involved in cell wall biosynthesis
MKVLFLTTHPNLPSSRFRIYQFLNYLRNEGIGCDVFPVMPVELYDKYYNAQRVFGRAIFHGLEIISRFKHILCSNKYDVLFIQKNLLSFNLNFISFLLRWIKTNVVFDFDDAIYLNTGQRLSPYLRFLEDPYQTRKIIKRSKIVLAGNDYLKNYALNYHNNVRVIPTSVDTDYFVMKKKISNSNKLTLLWTGSYGTNKYINLLGKVISELSPKYDVRLRIISNMTRFIDFFKFGKAELGFKYWNLATEIQDLHEADIGLVPLEDTEFSRGKCGLKTLMFMSCGIAVVASGVGVNTSIIKDGVNGFLADSGQSWIDKLSLLIEDKELRCRMGWEARKTVEANYSLKVNAPRLKAILLEAC